MGMFSKLTDEETEVLVSKLMSGNAVTRVVYGQGQHDMLMEGHDVIGEVQENYPSRREASGQE